MSNHIYKKVEIVGTSEVSMEDAVKNALSRANKTLSNLRWFEVEEIRGDIRDGNIGHWQVTVKIGFTLNEK